MSTELEATQTQTEVPASQPEKKAPKRMTKGEKNAEVLRKAEAGRKPAKKASKPASKKPAKAAAKKSSKKKTDVAAGAAAVLTSKNNAEKTAQPGIISDICQLLRDAKQQKVMYSVDDLGRELAAKHPDRKLEGMLVTVRAQVSRLPRERNFKIDKVRDGHIMRYAAA